MFFPLVSVSLIGLWFALRAPAAAGPQSKLVKVALVGAWTGFALGALVGLVVNVLVIGSFWLGLLGHLAAILGARAAVEGDRLLDAAPSRAAVGKR